MPSVVDSTLPTGTGTVARKKKNEAEQPAGGGRPVNFRAPPDLASDLDYIAEALGLDVSNLVRMILRENITPYRQRADRIKEMRDGGD